MKETKTVAVNCVICGWEGRRHRTEMAFIYHRAPCPKCDRRAVFHASPKKPVPRLKK